MREPQPYWIDCVSEAFDVAGIEATDDQIKEVACWVASGHEMYGVSHGYECIPNPSVERAEKAEKALKLEQSKIHCVECNGTGRIYSQGPHHGSDSQCWKCRGEGKFIP